VLAGCDGGSASRERERELESALAAKDREIDALKRALAAMLRAEMRDDSFLQRQAGDRARAAAPAGTEDSSGGSEAVL
jgi:hypothetical protein